MGRRRTKHPELPQRVYRPHSMYYYVPKIRAPGQPARISLSRDFAEAMVAYAKLITRPRVLHTLGALFDRYQIEVLPLKAPRTQRDNLKELLRLRACFGAMHPHDLTAQHIYQYMDDRKAPVRANREKALLSHVCSYGVRWGAMPANPCQGVRRHTEIPRSRCPTWEELNEFKRFCPEVVSLYVDFKYKTAMRKGDILRLLLGSFTTAGIAYNEAKKARRRLLNVRGTVQAVPVERRRLVRWDAELRSLVERIRALPNRKVGSLYLFSRRGGRPYTETGFDSIWQRAMKAFVAAGGMRFHEHDIRARSATDAPETAAARLGDTEEQARAYIRRVDEDAYDPIPLKKAG